MAYAINVDEMLSKILGGYAERTGSGVNPTHFGYDGSVKPYPYDLERAKKLLAEAGYPNGFEATLNTYSGTITSMDQMADAIGGYLAKVGIKVKRRHIEDVGTWTNSGKEGKLEGMQYYSWGSNSIFDADALLYALGYSKEPLSYIKDPEFDKLLEAGVLVSCAGMEVQPSAADFKNPVIKGEYYEVPQYDGFWHYAPTAEPAQGTKGAHGAFLPLRFLLSVTNPNPYPVLLEGVTFTVAFDELFEIYSGNNNDSYWIPAGKTSHVRLNTLVTTQSAL